MPLGYRQLIELVEAGAISGLADLGQVNPASINIRLGDEIALERADGELQYELGATPELFRTRLSAWEGGFALAPKAVLLGHSIETFRIPDDVCGYYVTRSSVGRCFLDHMDSGFIDPGFCGQLTLELVNQLRFQQPILRSGMQIGQVVLCRLDEPVPEAVSYRTRGRYHGQLGPTFSKGVQ